MRLAVGAAAGWAKAQSVAAVAELPGACGRVRLAVVSCSLFRPCIGFLHDSPDASITASPPSHTKHPTPAQPPPGRRTTTLGSQLSRQKSTT